MKKALRLYKKLLSDGQLNDITDRELFGDYFDPEVHDAIAVIADSLDFDLVELPHDVYMVPKLTNAQFGFTMKDIRIGISANARLADAYLQCYIIMLLLYLFFGGKNTNPKNTEFLQVRDIVTEIDARFASVDSDTPETHYAVSFQSIKEIWVNKPVCDDGKRSTRLEFVLKACRFLERQHLIRLVDNDTEVRTCQRLDDLMLNYYLAEDRVNEINEMFRAGGMACQKSTE